ncbi:MAG TPA: hypothetical protein VJA21_17835 [Verrucomicrobiae bacterium]
MRTSFAAHIVLMALILRGTAGQSTLPSMPDREEAVVAALFQEELDAIHGSVRSRVLVNTTTVTNLDLWRSYAQLIKNLRARATQREPAFAEALDDLLKKNGTAAYISASHMAKHGVRLVAPETFKKMWCGSADDFEDRLKFYEHADSQNLVAVSRVGLDIRNELGIVCFALRDPRDEQGHSHAEVFRREGSQWLVDRYRRYPGGPPTTNTLTIACELRYYLARPEDYTAPLRTVLTVLGASRTNLSCSVPSPFRLYSSVPNEEQLLGFVLQVVEPSAYAGKPMTLHFWDGLMQPYRLFQFGKRYELQVPDFIVGDTNFDLGY